MNIAIIDDMLYARQALANFVNRYGTENNLHIKIELFDSGEAFLLKFHSGAFDIIFLDIFMKELSGMDTAERVRRKDDTCLLIFSTNSADYAIKSFRVRAFDYLLKPYNYKQFYEVMQLCDQSLGKQSHYIEVKESRELVKILIKDIIYTDYSNHYIQIHTKERIIRSYMPFSEFWPLLESYPQCLCCYRNLIVNMDHIDTMENFDFVLTNGERIPIAKASRTDIRRQYADYVFAQL